MVCAKMKKRKKKRENRNEKIDVSKVPRTNAIKDFQKYKHISTKMIFK